MFLDIGAGILLSIFLGNYFNIQITLLWVLFGIVTVLLPDIDIFYYGIRKLLSKKTIYNHRSFTHYPIVYIPLILVTYYIFGLHVAMLFGFAIYFHLLHDTLWLGWGIIWFYPFSTRRFKFFPDRNGEISSKLLMTWTQKEESEIFKKYHNPNWIHDFYLRINIVSCVEYSVFSFSLILLYSIFLR